MSLKCGMTRIKARQSSTQEECESRNYKRGQSRGAAALLIITTPAVHVMQTRSRLLLASSETMTTIIHAGTEPLQMSWSTKQDMRSRLVMWLLQPIMFTWRQNNPSSYFASWGKIDTSQKMYLLHQNTLSDIFGYGYHGISLKGFGSDTDIVFQ